jgi:hypothetical protein
MELYEGNKHPLKAILETIRERADDALKQLKEDEEERAMRWRCKNCHYTKHFTRPVPFGPSRNQLVSKTTVYERQLPR